MKYVKEELKLEVLSGFLYPGMMLKGDAFTEMGQKIIDKYVPLTKEQIEMIQSNGIKKLYYTQNSYRVKKKITNPVFEDDTIDNAVSMLDEIQTRIEEEGERYKLPKGNVEDIVQTFIENIREKPDACLNLLDLLQYDDYTYTHSINVAALCILIGLSLSMDESKIRMLGVAGLLHDIGKTQVDKKIIDKAEKLTEAEWIAIKQHPVHGYKMLQQQADFYPGVEKIVLCHHESYSGGGYPFGVTSDKINLYSQIVSIADVFDSLTTRRPYKEAWPFSDAFAYFMAQSGIKFNPKLTQLFLRESAKKINEEPIYPAGCFVILNTKEIACVMGYRLSPFTLRPIIVIFMTQENKPTPRRLQIDLENDPQRFIVKRIMNEKLHRELEMIFASK